MMGKTALRQGILCRNAGQLLGAIGNFNNMKTKAGFYRAMGYTHRLIKNNCALHWLLPCVFSFRLSFFW